MSVTTIIFDMDETLITDGDATRAALEHIAQRAQALCDIDIEEFQRSAYRNMERLWRTSPAFAYCESIGISATEGLWGHFTGQGTALQALHDWVPGYQVRVWECALAEQNCADHVLAEQLAELFHEQRRLHQAFFPETEAMLQALQARYKLGLLTNGASDLQREKIEHFHLEHYFDEIVVSGEIGVGKPQPEVFMVLLERLATAPHAAIMVGDSLERDMLGAARSGLKGVWVNRTGLVPEPRYAGLNMAQIANLRELYQVL